MVRWLAALLACEGPEPSDTSTDTPDPGDTSDATGASTGHTGPAPTVSGACTVQLDNALRVDCDVLVSPPGPIAITATAADGELRTATSAAEVAEHHVTLWRLYPNTPYDVVITALDSGETAIGAFLTDLLPDHVQPAVELSGATTSTEDVLVMLGCGAPRAVVLDRDGRVVWYQDLAEGLPSGTPAHALTFTTEGDVAAILSHDRVRRFGLDGGLRMEVTQHTTPGFDKIVHHDLFARDGWLWVINASITESNGTDYVLDGLYVFDRSGAVVAEWALADSYVPRAPIPDVSNYWADEFPGASDASHANGLYVDERLDVTLSFNLLNAIVKLRGDPLAADFGRWVWDLDTSGPWRSDFSVTDPDGLTDDDTFERQHHPLPLPDGELQLFDNGYSGVSRVLRLALDEARGEAIVRGSWPVGEFCPIAGSAFELGNGNVLATCSNSSTMSEIDPGSGAIVRTMSLSCTTGPPILVARGIPVTL